MGKQFKTFILRGNVMDLAVAVVIGAAFGSVVTAVVKDLLTPLLAIPGHAANFSALSFTVRRSVFHYGDVVNQAIAFVIVAAAIFFLVVVPLNRLQSARAAAPTTRDCPECLSSIPLAASRCAFCTSEVAPLQGA